MFQEAATMHGQVGRELKSESLTAIQHSLQRGMFFIFI